MRYSFALAALALTLGCTGSEGEELPPEIVSFEIDPATVVAGGEVTSHIEVANFEMSGHHEGDHHARVAHDGEHHGAKGHVHIYLDDLMSNPLLMQVEHEEVLQIPLETEPGAHTLIARLHGDDHKILEPQVTAAFDIDVLAAE